MRLGFSYRSSSTRGRSTVALLLAGSATRVLPLLWADADAWSDNLAWKDAK